jgi:hypothetical protein
MDFVTIAAAAERPQETGQMWALLITPLAFWFGVSVKNRLMKVQGKNPSPTGDEKALSGVKLQVTGGSDTTSDTTPERGQALDIWVAQRAGKVRTMDLVREAKRLFGASKPTVMRALRRVRRGGPS